MKKILLQEAFAELNDAIAYYEEQQPGLGLNMKISKVERQILLLLLILFQDSLVMRVFSLGSKTTATYTNKPNQASIK